MNIACDVRTRATVLRRVEEQESYEKIAESCSVHKNTVTKFVRQSRALMPGKEALEKAVRLLKLQDVDVVEAADPVGRRLKFAWNLRHIEDRALDLAAVLRQLGAQPVLETAKFNLKAESYPEGYVCTKGNTEYRVVARHWIPASVECEERLAIYAVLTTLLRQLPVPAAQSGGGLTSTDIVKLGRQHKLYLVQVLQGSSLSLEAAVDYLRVHVDPAFPLVDLSTLSRSARQMGVRYRREHQFDPKQTAKLAGKLEQLDFYHELNRADLSKSVLRGDNLLFLDETNFHFNLDHPTTRSWTSGEHETPVSKNKSSYVAVVATMGIAVNPDATDNDLGIDTDALKQWTHRQNAAEARGERLNGWGLAHGESTLKHHLFLMWHIIPPSRKGALKLRYEYDEPFTEAEKAFLNRFKKVTDLTQIAKILIALGVDERVVTPDGATFEDRMASDEELAYRWSRVKQQRRKGLPRRFIGVPYKGGTPTAELSSTSKFLQYMNDLGVFTKAFFGSEVLGDTRVLVDNASTHGRVLVNQPAASSLHGFARDLGFEGVVFPPPYTPKHNSVEVLFAYLKDVIASRPMPRQTGEWTATELTALVDDAMQHVTPAMVTNWIRSRGYRFVSTHLPALYVRKHGSTYVAEAHDPDTQRATGLVAGEPPRLVYASPERRAARAREQQALDDLAQQVEAQIQACAELFKRFALFELQRGTSRDARTIGPLMNELQRLLPMYSTSYAALRGAPMESQLEVARAVLVYHMRALKRGRQQSTSRLCELGVPGACAPTASACARVGMGPRHDRARCVNELGQVSGLSALRGERIEKHYLRITRSTTALDDLFWKVASALANNDRTAFDALDPGVSTLASWWTSLKRELGGNPKGHEPCSIINPPKPSLQPDDVGEAVVIAKEGRGRKQRWTLTLRGAQVPIEATEQLSRKLANTNSMKGNVRTVSMDSDGKWTATIGQTSLEVPVLKDSLRIMLKDWNRWRMLPTGTRDMMRVWYVDAQKSSHEFQVASRDFEAHNLPGKLVLEVFANKEMSGKPVVYKHVGNRADAMLERVRSLFLKELPQTGPTKEQMQELQQAFGTKLLIKLVDEAIASRFKAACTDQTHAPVWLVNKMFETGANPPPHLQGLWDHFSTRNLTGFDGLRNTGNLTEDKRSFMQSKADADTDRVQRLWSSFVKRRLLETVFPYDVLVKAEQYEQVDGSVPFFKAGSAFASVDASAPTQRWPGYPVLGYFEALKAIRDKGLRLPVANEDARHLLATYPEDCFYFVFTRYDQDSEAVRNTLLQMSDTSKSTGSFSLGSITSFTSQPPSDWDKKKDEKKLDSWNKLLEEKLRHPQQLYAQGSKSIRYPCVLIGTIEEARQEITETQAWLHKEMFTKDDWKATTEDQKGLIYKFIQNQMYLTVREGIYPWDRMVKETAKGSEKMEPGQFRLLSKQLAKDIQKHTTENYSEDAWLVFFLDTHRRDTTARATKVWDTDWIKPADITLQKPLEDLQDKLEIGMPWSFAGHTQLQPRNALFVLNPLRLMSLEDTLLLEQEHAHKALEDYLTEFAEKNSLEAPKLRKSSFMKDYDEYVAKHVATYPNLGPTPETVDEYLVLTTGSAEQKDWLLTTREDIAESNDPVLRALLDVSDRAHAQREKRVTKLKKQRGDALDSFSVHEFKPLPPDEPSYFLTMVINDKKLNAMSVAHIREAREMQIKDESKTITLYQRTPYKRLGSNMTIDKIAKFLPRSFYKKRLGNQTLRLFKTDSFYDYKSAEQRALSSDKAQQRMGHVAVARPQGKGFVMRYSSTSNDPDERYGLVLEQGGKFTVVQFSIGEELFTGLTKAQMDEL